MFITYKGKKFFVEDGRLELGWETRYEVWSAENLNEFVGLSKLRTLKYLFINDCYIKDISPIKNLMSLESLIIHNIQKLY